MKYFIILAVLLLTGCSTTVPVTNKFPEAPEHLLNQRCPVLKQLSDGVQLSSVAKTVSENYTLYYECSIKVDAWNDWYSEQKKIFERLK